MSATKGRAEPINKMVTAPRDSTNGGTACTTVAVAAMARSSLLWGYRPAHIPATSASTMAAASAVPDSSSVHGPRSASTVVTGWA